MNQNAGTQPIKKVGPAVPPKPKKPQPQVPKSYQLSGACEPSYSLPLQTTLPEAKRPSSNSGPVYSNITPVNESNDNVYSNIEQSAPMQHLYSNLEPYSKTHVIEDPDAFKTWLTSEVKSMIEADPVALAKYIYALVKKNKPVVELREKAISQLEVFFKDKTVPFVEMLFRTIATKSYIASKSDVSTAPEMSQPPALIGVLEEALTKLESKPDETNVVVKETSGETLVESLDKTEISVSRKLDESKPLLRKRSSLSPPRKYKRSRSRSSRIRSRSPRLRSRSRSRSRSRLRSRSISWERRDRRRRSPYPRASHSIRYRRFSSDRKYYSSRRRSYSRSRSLSPIRSRSRSRSASRSRSRSSSRSPRKPRYKHRNPSPLSSSVRKSSRNEKERFIEDLPGKERKYDIISTSVKSDFTSVPTNFSYSSSQRQRCVDFDEKGFCMKGDLCPFDHGVNPVVLEPSSVPLLPIQQQRTVVANPKPYLPYKEALEAESQYNPTSMKTNLAEWVSQKIRNDSLLKQDKDVEVRSHLDTTEKPKGNVFKRLGPKPGQEESSTSTLEIRSIPHNLNTITLLFNHFSQFGNVVNIKVTHDDDPGAALVTFSEAHEAAAALRSSTPVMRNRFIKVALHDPALIVKTEKEENIPPVHVTINSALKTDHRFKKQLKPPSFNLRATTILDRKRKVIKPPDVKKKKIEAKLITANLLKLKQELLEEQIQKQKILIEKLEKSQSSSEDRSSLLETIKMLDGSIKEIKSSLANSVNKLKAANKTFNLATLSPTDKKARLADVKRDLLDAELDLFTSKQKGSDPSEIEKKILLLKKQLMVLDDGNLPTSTTIRRPVPAIPKVFSDDQEVDPQNDLPPPPPEPAEYGTCGEVLSDAEFPPPPSPVSSSYSELRRATNYQPDFGTYAPPSQSSSTYESIYEPINPRPPSTMSNYSLYANYGKRQPSGAPVEESEVDALTDLLVQSMNSSSADSDTYGECSECGGRIVDEGSGCTALDRLFHVSCFTCAHCGIQLQGKPFYDLEGKPYCKQGYLDTLEKCSVCVHPILDRILRATGRPYHPKCFCCVVCGKSLDGIPFTVDATNQIHCIEDFHKKFAPRCCICKLPIMPEPGQDETIRVVALDRSFHTACYRCEDCGLVLSSEAEGRGCYPLDDHILCKSCNARRVQELSSGIFVQSF